MTNLARRLLSKRRFLSFKTKNQMIFNTIVKGTYIEIFKTR